MAIRFIDQPISIGAIASTLDGAAAALAGTHVGPAGRTGVFGSQMGGVFSNIVGAFSHAQGRTGSLSSTMDGLTSSFVGSNGADTTAPTIPTGLTATPISQTQIDLAWTASTDPVPTVWPLAADVTGRFLVDGFGAPRPSLGRTAWNVISLSVANYQAFITDTLNKGFNAIELSIPHRDPRSVASPFAGNGAAPFSTLLNGATWAGDFSYGSNAPDFTQPNATYWAFVDTFIAYCESVGMALHLFPAYMGYAGTDQGWMTEMLANGATRMQTYGAFVGNRYKNRGNIVWMIGGDQGTNPTFFDSTQIAVEQGMLTGLFGAGGNSTLVSAEWTGNSIGTDETNFGHYMTFNPSYSSRGLTGTYSRNAYAHTPTIPAFLDEEPYDEEGADGNNVNTDATQPVRRFNWWGWINAIGGYCAGNGYVWLFNSGYTAHLSTQGAIDCSVMNAFIKSLSNWFLLVPDGLGSIGTLITAGKGTIDTSNYVAAAATPDHSLLVAYLSPSAGNPTVDMTKMRGTTTARWLNPTSGAYTAIGSFANTGTRTFTKPGNNGTGFSDWVLRLDA